MIVNNLVNQMESLMKLHKDKENITKSCSFLYVAKEAWTSGLSMWGQV